LARACVLGVLEYFLLAVGAAEQVKGSLSESQGLAHDGLREPDAKADEVGSIAGLPELRQAPAHASGVSASLLQVRFEPVAVGAAWSDRDLSLQHAYQGALGRMGLVEVLDDLLLLGGGHGLSVSIVRKLLGVAG